jgi:hypothetical protein
MRWASHALSQLAAHEDSKELMTRAPAHEALPDVVDRDGDQDDEDWGEAARTERCLSRCSTASRATSTCSTRATRGSWCESSRPPRGLRPRQLRARERGKMKHLLILALFSALAGELRKLRIHDRSRKTWASTSQPGAKNSERNQGEPQPDDVRATSCTEAQSRAGGVRGRERRELGSRRRRRTVAREQVLRMQPGQWRRHSLLLPHVAVLPLPDQRNAVRRTQLIPRFSFRGNYTRL